jgi:hypothetical protein
MAFAAAPSQICEAVFLGTCWLHMTSKTPGLPRTSACEGEGADETGQVLGMAAAAAFPPTHGRGITTLAECVCIAGPQW